MSRMRFGIVAVCLTIVPFSGYGSEGEPGDWLTLEDIFGGTAFHSTEPTSEMWLPDGSGFVFRDTRDGVSGLYGFDLKVGRAELVVDWSELMTGLAGQRPSWSTPAMDDVNTHPGSGAEPSVSPDGSMLLGVTAGDLFLLDLATGSARFLTDEPGLERFPTFSPDGGRVAFTRLGDLFWIDVTTGEEHRLTDRDGDAQLLNGAADWVYEEELDVERSFWWSPDGDRLLYVQYDTSPLAPFPITDELELVATVEWQRYPKAGTANSIVRLGVVPAGGGETSWIPTGVGDGYIVRAGWMPGGRQAWFQVLNRDQTRLELRTAVPGGGSSSVLVADQAPDWVNVRDDLIFVGEDRFVWSSERDGWRHLYLYGIDGRMLRRLTRGEWQVEAVYGIDAAGTNVVFRANAEDYRERHIYSVPIDGGPVRPLMAEPGTHSGLLSPDGRHVLDTFSSLETPPRLELWTVAGQRVAVVDDGAIAALDGIDLETPELGAVTADDGETLFTWMFRPPAFDPAVRYPVLVYVYGGPGSQQVVNRWGGTRFLFMQYLARRGMVVFCLDNRGSWGRGHAFEAVVHRRLGEVELADQLAGVRHLKRQPWVDPDRIGIYGGSYGGTMVLLAMLRAAEHFRAGIAYAPVTDWRLYDTIYTERYMDRPADNPDGYDASSPVTHAGGLAGALLVCHGTMDNNVHLQNTIRLLDRSIEEGKRFELMLYPGTRHGIRIGDRRLHFHRLKVDFLKRHLLQ